MTDLLRELITHWIGQYINAVEMLCGGLLALALWFLDYAVKIARRQPFQALILVVAGVGLSVLPLAVQWNGWGLARVLAIAVVYYLIFRMANYRRARSRRDQI